MRRRRILFAALAMVLLVGGPLLALWHDSGRMAEPGVGTSVATRSPAGPSTAPSVAPISALQAALRQTGISGFVTPVGVTISTGALTSGGMTRTFLLAAPAMPAPGVPLLVGLQGRNATPRDELERDELLPLVAAGEAVLVYPTAYHQGWNVDADDCCGDPAAAGIDDVRFIGAVVDEVRGELGLTGTTSLVGYSNGGRLAFDIACRDPGRYDAIAVVSAAPTAACATGRPIPLLAIVNADDNELPSQEDPIDPVAVLAEIATTWTARNGCTQTRSVSRNATRTVASWNDCVSGAPVRTVLYAAGLALSDPSHDIVGHGWVESEVAGDGGAAGEVWAFLTGARRI